MTTEDQRQDRPAPLVAVASAEAVLRHPEAGEHLLTALEHERAARFRKESGRRDFTAGHVLVRLCAARLLGVPVTTLTLAQNCPDCGRADHGKPFLPDHPDVHVSLSHTHGVVAAAAGFDPVGVDVELAARGGTLRGVAERVLTPAELALVDAAPEPERAFLRLWVRKESLIKIGRASMDTLSEVDLSAVPLDVPADGPLRSRYRDLHLLDWTDPGHGAAVAAVSTAEPRVVELTTAG
ncbi:4'-phosphopantetheinyl transferase superfamily protein [Streptomyces kaniharaensis]|uniref:4'-phosphopantetheinyl transferase superfamily protein n=1 Tax=Streptomyces kaniharaensis TaxID=212423 RepID=A0A6N7KKI4_9ACTN|nr:4'-phosphopantetheinyl transferase superfamily protein [Streptomyces kaniharaensis]MQS12040.1 4'-phosphopantetheinyl transferase superfamily protein [Streptomyces kaniharaensis]